MGTSLIFCIDVDGTLCSLTSNQEYHFAKPNTLVIKMVNKLYDAGHYIKIFTARGMASGKDFEGITERQLKEWDVKYHELIMSKPSADYYIDDKGVSPEEFVNTVWNMN